MTITQELYEERKSKAIAQLGGSCVVCGITENLEFDHINPKDKLFTITNIFDRTDALIFELQKCQLLCKTHHVEKTLKDLGQLSGRETHGTLTSYKYCKCDLCRKAKSDWNRKMKPPRQTTDRKSARGTHGTRAAYKYCEPPKCNSCKAAHAAYMNNYNNNPPPPRKFINPLPVS